MTPEELKNILAELEPLRAARVPLEAVRWTHGRKDGPVALVTGPGSRARADFSSGLKQTARYVRVEHFLARLDDPSAVAAAIRRAKDAPEILVIAVCRGGGDEHDLSVFSHPDVVRAVAEAATIKPVVTGIGHTEDHCLADDYASMPAALPYAAGEVIHQARQSAWRRLQPERAWTTYSRAPRSEERSETRQSVTWSRRRTAHDREVTVMLMVAGVIGIFMAIASCPADQRLPATIAPTTHYSAPKTQVATKKKRSAPSRQQPPVAPTRPPEEQAAPPPQQPASIPTRPPEDQPAAPLQEPGVVQETPREDQG